LPYIIILIFIGLLNYNRSNIFYVFPVSTKDNLYTYFLPKVVAKSQNVSNKESIKILEDKRKILIDENNLDLENEKDLMQFYKMQSELVYNVLLNNKIITIEKAFMAYLHSTLLNPIEVLFTRIKGKEYYKSELHKKTIKYRIIYSLLIFFITFLGFINIIKQKIIFPHIILACGVYFFIISGWVGYTRYFVPTFLSFSIYFAYGASFILSKKFYFKQR